MGPAFLMSEVGCAQHDHTQLLPTVISMVPATGAAQCVDQLLVVQCMATSPRQSVGRAFHSRSHAARWRRVVGGVV